MIVKIVPNLKDNPRGKLADAELHFTDGVLDGLKLIGFAVWERRSGGGRTVTFPARQYIVNGDRRSFVLLRPVVDAAAQDRGQARRGGEGRAIVSVGSKEIEVVIGQAGEGRFLLRAAPDALLSPERFMLSGEAGACPMAGRRSAPATSRIPARIPHNCR